MKARLADSCRKHLLPTACKATAPKIYRCTCTFIFSKFELNNQLHRAASLATAAHQVILSKIEQQRQSAQGHVLGNCEAKSGERRRVTTRGPQKNGCEVCRHCSEHLLTAFKTAFNAQKQQNARGKRTLAFDTNPGLITKFVRSMMVARVEGFTTPTLVVPRKGALKTDLAG